MLAALIHRSLGLEVSLIPCFCNLRVEQWRYCQPSVLSAAGRTTRLPSGAGNEQEEPPSRFIPSVAGHSSPQIKAGRRVLKSRGWMQL